MKTAPLPANEPQRLQSLHQYAILDTLPEDDYDAITRLASVVCQTPISLITLIDHDRQWFKSAYGLELTERELPRDTSFCGHVVAEPTQLFEVPDARQDERFHDNPYTSGPLRVEFYAGAPLLDSEGNALGSLCVIDHHPRHLTDAQRLALRDLARQVSQLLELRRRNHELADSQLRLRQTEADLKRALVVEQKTNELKSRFVSLVSHEFRTPLAIILSGIELIEMIGRKVKDPAVAQQLLENIEPVRLEILRLKHLIGMAVQQEHLQSNRVRFHLIPCNLASFCTELLQRRRQQDDAYQRIVFHSDAATAPVLADPMLLENILDNLLNNALKYSAHSPCPVEMELSLEAHTATVAITDYGIGIPAEDLSRIGEGFFRASNAEGISGTGLGLALARQLIELQNGSLTVESELGAFTRCRLSLPLTPDDAPSAF